MHHRKMLVRIKAKHVSIHIDLIIIFYREHSYKIYILDVHGKSSGLQRRNVCKLGI
jgi:hypothetical protein